MGFLDNIITAISPEAGYSGKRGGKPWRSCGGMTQQAMGA